MEVLYAGALPVDVLPLITGTTVVTLGVVASGLAAFAKARASDVALTRSISGRLRIVAFPSDARPTIDPPPESTLISNRVAVFTARPGRIKKVISVEEGHPRPRSFMTSSKLTALRNELYELLHDDVVATMRASLGMPAGTRS